MNAEPVVTRLRSAGSGVRVSRRTVRGIGVALAAVLLTSACAAGQQAQTSDEVSAIDGENQNVGSIALRGVAVVAPLDGQKAYLKGTDAQLTVVIVNKGLSSDRLVDVKTSAAGGWAAFSDYNDAFAVQQASGAQVTGSPVPSSSSATATTTAPSSDTASGTDSQSTGPSGSPGASDSTSPEPSDSSSSSSSSSAPSTSSSSAAALPTGVQSVTIPSGGRVGFGTPTATGALLLTGLTQKLFPGTTIKITVTFAKAGTATLTVPIELASLARTAQVGGGTDSEGDAG